MVTQIVTLDLLSLGLVDLGAPTAWLASEALRRLNIYAGVFDTIHRTPKAMETLAHVIDNYVHYTVLAHENHAIEYYGEHTYEYLVALVLRQDANAQPFAEDYLAANDAISHHAFISPPPPQSWASDPLAASLSASSRTLSRAGQKLYLRGNFATLSSELKSSPVLKTLISELNFTTHRMLIHPATLALRSHMRAMRVPVVEELAGGVVDDSDFNPQGLILPQDIASRARRIDGLMRGCKPLRPLRDRLSLLAKQADTFTASVFCDGHLALQAAALLQRPNSLRTLSGALARLEQEGREGLTEYLISQPFRVIQPPQATAEPASLPTHRPSWWSPDEPDLPSLLLPPAPSAPAATAEARAVLATPVQPLQAITFAPGVRLMSRMSKKNLSELLLSTFDPGTFGYAHPHPTTASAASAHYHVRKHGHPHAAVEDYIFEAREAFRQGYVGEVSARAGSFGERIKMVKNEHHYGCYSWDERILTFCNRQRCGEEHYPSALSLANVNDQVG